MSQIIFDSRRLGLNDFFVRTFKTIGSFNYYSTISRTLNGRVDVDNKPSSRQATEPISYNADIVTTDTPGEYIVHPPRYQLYVGDSILWSFVGYEEAAAYDIVGTGDDNQLDSRILRMNNAYGIAMFDVGTHIYKAYRLDPDPPHSSDLAFKLVVEGQILISEDYQDQSDVVEIVLPLVNTHPEPIRGTPLLRVLWTITEGGWYITCEK